MSDNQSVRCLREKLPRGHLRTETDEQTTDEIRGVDVRSRFWGTAMIATPTTPFGDRCTVT